ncbi:MAG: DUF1573 domain-containing protein [Paludibacteraceae bacterium]|nr:DUF1573 domain-containing protein [Paludibacteraceae bacterium]MBP6284512.1 DUF1573 domain-containing protein [Paludibacteraceae bacterium]
MKSKLFIVGVLVNLLIGVTGIAFAQQESVSSFPAGTVAGLNFEKTTHDFGTFNEVDGRVETVFVFQNTSKENLVVSRVQASCGCTTPDWSKEPIAPGKKGFVKVSYNPAGRPGNFNKSATVSTNLGSQVLYIKGQVVPVAKPAK